MSVVLVIGAQWGDEGKGKIVDLYAQDADLVVRYGGGANAGHTLVVRGEKVVLHLLPSGILHAGKRCMLAQGMVIDPEVLLSEIRELEARGVSVRDRLHLSDRAHIVLPQHKIIDGLREQGAGAIGTTKRGIGPAYEDKVARRGIRVGDLLSRDRLEAKLAANLAAWQPVASALGGTLPTLESVMVPYLEHGRALEGYVLDVARIVGEGISGKKRILLEGAQGTLLDIDHGTYPYVTSSSTTAGGACAGAGIGPTAISSVVGITKAYATRVGGGPFPTELVGADGERLREIGEEFGATTGRPRRCGWLDMPALRHAVRVNGLTGLAITKLDVLTGLKEVPICVGYELDGKRIDDIPYEGLERVRPVLEVHPGWSEDLRGCKTMESLPSAARSYVAAIERAAGCPVWLVSIGPDREHTIQIKRPFA